MSFHNVPPNGFPDLPDVEELEAVQKDVKTLKTATAEQGAEITNLNTDKANKADIATEFSDLTNYNVGDLVYYEGSLYEFQVDHTAGAWETSEVIQKDLSDIITTLKSGLTNHNGNGNIKYLMIGDILVLTGTITGGGGTDVAIGTPSNFFGVVSVRNNSTGVMGTYFVLNGALNGWDGETQTTRTFTNGEEYQVSGNLYRHTS